ncbi:T9SS type A sorting domain-containing protein [Fodinibius saliphilus]|uniref:T9SS type A sorting domain-containing protein n=1 Tax=Fodinibius saliphilus TaxID=1920650 RepID=UPI0011097285|nr:T9SS type A sorting domain-containing protein [Fodinibius saliphilus]
MIVQVYKKIAVLFIICCVPLSLIGQKSKVENKKVYEVPIGSEGNLIQLVLANSTERDLSNLSVTVEEGPVWFKAQEEEYQIKSIEKEKEVPVTFTFGIIGEVSAGDSAIVHIKAENGSGFSWSKKIRLTAIAPSEFKLMPNYPNPFNPTTTIRYQLPDQMRVKVTIFNVLGRKVATLANEVQKAGQHDLQWNASNMASGLYFYRVVAEGKDQQRIVEQKKMMLVK